MIDFPHKIVIFSVKLLSSSSLFHSPVTFSILFSSYPFFLHFLAMRFSACSNFCWSLLPGNTHTLAHCQFKSNQIGKCPNPLDLSKKRWFRLINLLIINVVFQVRLRDIVTNVINKWRQWVISSCCWSYIHFSRWRFVDIDTLYISLRFYVTVFVWQNLTTIVNHLFMECVKNNEL